MPNTAHATIPEQSTVHVNERGDIEFMTPQGQRGEITEHGAALFDGNLPLVELDLSGAIEEDEYVDLFGLSNDKGIGVDPDKNPNRGQGHVSKDRK